MPKKTTKDPLALLAKTPTVEGPWPSIVAALVPQVGSIFCGGRYKLKGVDDRGFDLERVETKSKVRVTRSLTEKTYRKLVNGEKIAHRKISYTVAIEQGVLLALSVVVTVQDDGSNYSGAGA